MDERSGVAVAQEVGRRRRRRWVETAALCTDAHPQSARAHGHFLLVVVGRRRQRRRRWPHRRRWVLPDLQ